MRCRLERAVNLFDKGVCDIYKVDTLAAVRCVCDIWKSVLEETFSSCSSKTGIIDRSSFSVVCTLSLEQSSDAQMEEELNCTVSDTVLESRPISIQALLDTRNTLDFTAIKTDEYFIESVVSA